MPLTNITEKKAEGLELVLDNMLLGFKMLNDCEPDFIIINAGFRPLLDLLPGCDLTAEVGLAVYCKYKGVKVCLEDREPFIRLEKYPF